MNKWLKELTESLELNTFFLVPAMSDHAVQWLDQYGNITYSSEEMVSKQSVEIPRSKRASNATEFRIVYEREFVKSKLKDSPDDHRIFIRELRKHLKVLIKKHASNRDFHHTDFEAISTAEQFERYLDPYLIANPQLINLPDEEKIMNIVDKLPYDVHLHRYFSFDKAIVIHYKHNEGDDPEEYRRLVFSQENIQLIHLFEKKFSSADENGAIALLEHQYSRADVMGVPRSVWLENVQLIIDHGHLLKRSEYAKTDSVRLWFRTQEKILKEAELPEVPFIAELFFKNLNISTVVTDAYYNLVIQPKTEAQRPANYVGPLNHANSPYRRNYYGAFINMGTAEMLDFYMEKKISPYDKVSEEQINNGLKNYAKGFIKGYYDFDTQVLSSNPFQDSSHKINLIFDYVTGRMSGISSLPISHGQRNNYFAAWEETGVDAGKLYRAWYLVLENHTLFTPLFEEAKSKYEASIKEAVLQDAPKHTLAALALIYYYNGKTITRNNGDEIAKANGRNSGERLYQKFTHFSTPTNRKGAEDTKQKSKNKLTILLRVSEAVQPEFKSKVLEEIAALQASIAAAYN